MILEQKFYNVSINFWQDNGNLPGKKDINSILNLIREKILEDNYDDIEITIDKEDNVIYLDIGFNSDEPYYVETNLDYLPGFPGRGPTYSCGGEPPESPSIIGLYESIEDLWGKTLKLIPQKIKWEITEAKFDSEEDILIRIEEEI